MLFSLLLVLASLWLTNSCIKWLPFFNRLTLSEAYLHDKSQNFIECTLQHESSVRYTDHGIFF